MNNQLHKAAADLGLPLRLRIQVSGYDAMSLMVAAGMGLGVLPRESARLYLSGLGLRAVSLDEPWALRQLVVCVRSVEGLSPAARSLVYNLCSSPAGGTQAVGFHRPPGPAAVSRK